MTNTELSGEPWECPRCRSWNGPSSKCDCKPIKRIFCRDCWFESINSFPSPLPDRDTIEAFAAGIHSFAKCTVPEEPND